MQWLIVNSLLLSLAVALPGIPPTHALQKRDEDGTFSCYDLTNIIDFSALCPNINYPITNDRGLSTMGTLYFALASTDLPDDTVYNKHENIICAINGPTPNITATVGAQAGGDIVSAGASVSFTLASPNFAGSSICMFTESTEDDDAGPVDPITLAQARTLLYTMLTAPDVDCKTCGRIPIRYPAVKDGGGSTGGGILKIDVTSSNNCLGKCVGPASFSTTSPTPSSAAAARVRVGLTRDSSGSVFLAAMMVAWALGFAGFFRGWYV